MIYTFLGKGYVDALGAHEESIICLLYTSGISVKMMKMGQEGVPSVAGYLEAEVPENGCLGFDGRVVNALTGIDLEKRLKEKNARILCSDDLVGEIWEDRPCLLYTSRCV